MAKATPLFLPGSKRANRCGRERGTGVDTLQQPSRRSGERAYSWLLSLCGTSERERSVSKQRDTCSSVAPRTSEKALFARASRRLQLSSVLPISTHGLIFTMANTNTTPTAAPPDWRQREHQRRMNRVLILVVLVGMLVAFYYYLSFLGNVGPVSGLTFDTADHIAFVRQDDKGNTTLFAVRTDAPTYASRLRPMTSPTSRSLSGRATAKACSTPPTCEITRSRRSISWVRAARSNLPTVPATNPPLRSARMARRPPLSCKARSRPST